MTSKKYSITDVLAMLEECSIENFTWMFDDHAEAHTHRNSVNSLYCRRKDTDLKIKVTLLKAIKDDKIVSFVVVEAI